MGTGYIPPDIAQLMGMGLSREQAEKVAPTLQPRVEPTRSPIFISQEQWTPGGTQVAYNPVLEVLRREGEVKRTQEAYETVVGEVQRDEGAVLWGGYGGPSSVFWGGMLGLDRPAYYAEYQTHYINELRAQAGLPPISPSESPWAVSQQQRLEEAWAPYAREYAGYARVYDVYELIFPKKPVRQTIYRSALLGGRRLEYDLAPPEPEVPRGWKVAGYRETPSGIKWFLMGPPVVRGGTPVEYEFPPEPKVPEGWTIAGYRESPVKRTWFLLGPPEWVKEAPHQLPEPKTPADWLVWTGEKIKETTQPVEQVFESFFESQRENIRGIQKWSEEVWRTSGFLAGMGIGAAVVARAGVAALEAPTFLVRPTQWVETLESIWGLATSPEARATLVQYYVEDPIALAEIPGAILGGYVTGKVISAAVARLPVKLKYPKVPSGLVNVRFETYRAPEKLWIVPEGAVEKVLPSLVLKGGKARVVYQPPLEYFETAESFARKTLLKTGLTSKVLETGKGLVPYAPSTKSWSQSFASTLSKAVEQAQAQQLAQLAKIVPKVKLPVELAPLVGAGAGTASLLKKQQLITKTDVWTSEKVAFDWVKAAEQQQRSAVKTMMQAWTGKPYPGARRVREELEYEYYTMPGQVQRLTQIQKQFGVTGVQFKQAQRMEQSTRQQYSQLARQTQRMEQSFRQQQSQLTKQLQRFEQGLGPISSLSQIQRQMQRQIQRISQVQKITQIQRVTPPPPPLLFKLPSEKEMRSQARKAGWLGGWFEREHPIRDPLELFFGKAPRRKATRKRGKR